MWDLRGLLEFSKHTGYLSQLRRLPLMMLCIAQILIGSAGG